MSHQQPVIANHKIIAFVIFIATALMTSLFLFHLQSRAAQRLTPEEGLLFPAPRDIKSFELVTAENKKITQQALLQHWTLLYFGFTHCQSICPTTLAILNKAYETLQPIYPSLQVLFVSLDPDRDNPVTLLHYVHSFNPAFIGVTGKIDVIRQLQSQLGIFSGSDATPNGQMVNNNYQIEHTSLILLLDPHGQWVGLFKQGLTPTQLSTAIQKGIASLNQSSTVQNI